MTSRRRVLGGALATVTLGCAGLGPTWYAGQRRELTETVNGKARSALLVVPSAYDPARPWPLVLGAHGHAQTGRTMVDGFGWGATCDQRGYLGVFPTSPDEGEGEPDSDCFARFLDRVQAEHNVDPRRIYVTGFSAGCRRAYSFAATHSRRLAALAAHSGKIGHTEDPPAWWDPRATAAGPIHLIHIHGRKDDRIPIDGGPHVTPDGRERHVIPMREALEIWAGVDRAALVPGAPAPAGVPTRCTFHLWRAEDGHRVEGVMDPILGHEWSGYANQVFVDFFERTPPRA